MVQTPSQKFIGILGGHLMQTSQILSPKNPRLLYGLQVYPLLNTHCFFFLKIPVFSSISNSLILFGVSLSCQDYLSFILIRNSSLSK